MLDWLMIGLAATTAILWSHPLGYILAVLIIGNRQHALAVLGHDGSHYSISRNRTLNDHLSNALAFGPLGLIVDGYRGLHLQHHRETGTANDPELMHKAMRAPQWDLPTSPFRVLRYALMDLLGGAASDYGIIVRFAKPEKKSAVWGLIGVHGLTVASLATLGLWQVVVLWYAALLTSFMMFFRLRLWLEHQGTTDTQRVDLRPIEAMVLAPHNAWYHWEHHQFAAVPYHQLPALRKALNGPRPVKLVCLVNQFRNSSFVPSGQGR